MPYIMNGLRVSAAFKTAVDLQQTSTAYRNETVAWMPQETDNDIEITVTEDRVGNFFQAWNMNSLNNPICPSLTSSGQPSVQRGLIYRQQIHLLNSIT